MIEKILFENQSKESCIKIVESINQTIKMFNKKFPNEDPFISIKCYRKHKYIRDDEFYNDNISDSADFKITDRSKNNDINLATSISDNVKQRVEMIKAREKAIVKSELQKIEDKFKIPRSHASKRRLRKIIEDKKCVLKCLNDYELLKIEDCVLEVHSEIVDDSELYDINFIDSKVDIYENQKLNGVKFEVLKSFDELIDEFTKLDYKERNNHLMSSTKKVANFVKSMREIDRKKTFIDIYNEKINIMTKFTSDMGMRSRTHSLDTIDRFMTACVDKIIEENTELNNRLRGIDFSDHFKNPLINLYRDLFDKIDGKMRTLLKTMKLNELSISVKVIDMKSGCSIDI